MSAKTCTFEPIVEIPLFLFILIWIFCGTFVVCEKYFVPSLQLLGDRLNLSPDGTF